MAMSGSAALLGKPALRDVDAADQDRTPEVRNQAMHTERRLVCGFRMVGSSIAAG